MNRTHIAALAVLAAGILPAAGCANHHTVTKTKTVECVEIRDVDGNTIDRECETARTRTEHDRNDCHGVISCTAHAAGEVIALPFRITGAVLDVVF